MNISVSYGTRGVVYVLCCFFGSPMRLLLLLRGCCAGWLLQLLLCDAYAAALSGRGLRVLSTDLDASCVAFSLPAPGFPHELEFVLGPYIQVGGEVVVITACDGILPVIEHPRRQPYLYWVVECFLQTLYLRVGEAPQ